MARDFIRDLQKIGRNLTNIEPGDVPTRTVSPRVSFLVISQRSLLDPSAFYDGFKAAKMFRRADFQLYFLVNPDYAEFYAWITFFLELVPEYLAVVLTGFPVTAPDGGPGEGHPFVIKNREIPPSRLFKLVNEFKNAKSRLTLILNGCPAVESWSNAGTEAQKMLFSTSSSIQAPVLVKSFEGSVPDRVVLLSAAPRLDVPLKDRSRSGVSHFIRELSIATKADPILSAAELVDLLAPKLRKIGEEIVGYSSAGGVDTGTPFLL
jgi:hypothetical protein